MPHRSFALANYSVHGQKEPARRRRFVHQKNPAIKTLLNTGFL
jgi:hypothetical protein